MNEGNNGLLLNPRLIHRQFLSRGEAEGQKDDELTEGSTANLCCPSECRCQRVAANMATSPELRTPFFATRWRKKSGLPICDIFILCFKIMLIIEQGSAKLHLE